MIEEPPVRQAQWISILFLLRDALDNLEFRVRVAENFNHADHDGKIGELRSLLDRAKNVLASIEEPRRSGAPYQP